MSRHRNYCFTLNNYSTDEEFELRDYFTKYCKYAIYEHEVGIEKTPHLQGFVIWKNAKTMDAVKKINKRIHWEICNGDAASNIKYCSKDKDNVWEFGDRPCGQGKRNDLIEIKNNIMNGTKVRDLALDNPMLYHQYGRTLNYIEDLAMEKKWRTEMTKCIWYWGDTGVGKSLTAFKNYSPETHYVWQNDNGWWDMYNQQDTVIMNDFRGELPYNFLLQLIDCYPMSVKRRNRAPIPFVSKLIIITSSLHPEIVYWRRNDEDNIAQLLRRCQVIRLHSTEVVGGNTRPPPITPEVCLRRLDNNEILSIEDMTKRLKL